MNTKIVIFGCGKLGHEAIDVLGSENVLCFCDNSPKMIGTKQYGKQVISFAKLQETYSEAAVIICANVRYGNAWSMARQCEENGISDYFLWQSLRGKPFFPKQEETAAFLDDALNRQKMKTDMYIDKTKEQQKQIDYLKRHIDIRHIRPAGGKLREWQLSIVKETAELFEKLSELQIKPFLCGGNLVGWVRHNGFVPWDDDIDFAIMRKDYEKLREFCREHMYTKEEFYGEKESEKDVREDLKCYYYGNGGGEEFNIYRPVSRDLKIAVDFFVLDFYAEELSFEALMKEKDVLRLKLNDAVNGKKGGAIYDDAKRIRYFQETLEKNRDWLVEESSRIYFGFDNWDMIRECHRGGWIARETIFPLQKVLFEGQYFYVPNDAEEFLKFEYKNIWELPDDIGIPQHVRFSDEEKW